MVSGEAVVLRDGSLAQAVRASMAIPGVFTPVEIDGRVLADGGMIENIPVKTVRDMDVDAVIGVQLRLPPPDRVSLELLAGVLTRAVDVMVTQNEHRSMEMAQAQNHRRHDWILDDGLRSRRRNSFSSDTRPPQSQSAALLPYAIQDPAEWQQYLADRQMRAGTRRPRSE